MMDLSYRTLKINNPSFLNSCADKIVCMFKLVPFSYKRLARNDMHLAEKLRFFFSTIFVRDTIQIPLKEPWKVDFE